MNYDRFPRSLREVDGHNHGNSYISNSDPPPSLARLLFMPLLIVLVLAIIALCYWVAPDTKAYDCRDDSECVVLKSLRIEEKK